MFKEDKKTKCPHCGYTTDLLVGPVSDQPSKPGDMMLCHKCATLCQFIDGFELKEVGEKGEELLKEEHPVGYGIMMAIKQQIISRNEAKK